MNPPQELLDIVTELRALAPLVKPDLWPKEPDLAYWRASDIEDRLTATQRLAGKLRRNALARYRDDQPALFDDQEDQPTND